MSIQGIGEMTPLQFTNKWRDISLVQLSLALGVSENYLRKLLSKEYKNPEILKRNFWKMRRHLWLLDRYLEDARH